MAPEYNTTDRGTVLAKLRIADFGLRIYHAAESAIRNPKSAIKAGMTLPNPKSCTTKMMY